MARKVLVIEDEPSIRNVLYVLLAALKCEGEVAYSGQQALAMIGRESFDAVLLDLRCSDLPPDQMVSRINEIRPNLIGRVLFITGEVNSPEAAKLIERNCLRHDTHENLVQNLWERLRAILGSQAPARADRPN